MALDKGFSKTLKADFVECLSVGTRQNIFLIKKSLSSARDLALGKECFLDR
jgi:hypothetical protein